jgi:tetratricopeptide (TPR) repeat protein
MNKRTLAIGLIATLPLAEGAALAQTKRSDSGSTVRIHRQAQSDPIFTPELTRAEAAMDKQDYAAAEKDLLAAAAANPKNYRAWFDLGFVYNQTNRQPQAIEAYRKSVEANPQVFESTLNLGLMLARANDPEAATYLRAATQLKPAARQEEGWYRAWLSLGQATKSTNPAEAIEAFRNAAKLKPNDAESHLSAGLLLEQQNRLAEAAAEYQKAAQLDPKSSEALAGLVNAYTKLEQFPEAEAALRKFLALDPNNAAAHVQLGRVLAAEHKWDDATAELEQGLRAKPGDVAAEKEIAGIYMAQHLYKEAIPHLQAALKVAPNDAQLHHSLALALIDEKRFPEAQNELMTALKLKPDFGDAYGDLAIAASGNNNYPLAIKALDQRAKLLPEVPATYFLRATAYDHLKDMKHAIENYKKFLELADGRFPEEEWKAKHRLIAIDPKSK